MKRIATIFASSALLALSPAIAQTAKESVPKAAGADASGGLAPTSVGKPARTVGGATRGVKKSEPKDQQPAGAKEKSEDPKAAAAATTAK
ncbi:MAG: hypothetical protein IPH39_17390 [Sulfuritalea sp.]|jgi:hypothetical protein|nr:hypothetical protein [Sulfuritalea sp.]MBK8762079.1 hypothetical protein [Sulfuritalea sp.]MBK9350061.1 hypothetical protein [Sulfuritalea sp.]MBP6636731.1 hypothetical protein [Sulfuritalea sp.]